MVSVLIVTLSALNHPNKVSMPDVVPDLPCRTVDTEHALDLTVLYRVDGIVPIEWVGLLFSTNAWPIDIQPALGDLDSLFLGERIRFAWAAHHHCATPVHPVARVPHHVRAYLRPNLAGGFVYHHLHCSDAAVVLTNDGVETSLKLHQLGDL